MSKKKVKILILHVDTAIREIMVSHFEELGYEVMSASQPDLCPVYNHKGCAAKERCADAILIEQNMPGMTGLEFIRMQAERGCKLPPQCKLIMSEEITESLKASAEDFGCHLVEKPLSLAKAKAFVLATKAAKTSE